jgi:hypothetical protein
MITSSDKIEILEVISQAPITPENLFNYRIKKHKSYDIHDLSYILHIWFKDGSLELQGKYYDNSLDTTKDTLIITNKGKGVLEELKYNKKYKYWIWVKNPDNTWKILIGISTLLVAIFFARCTLIII